MSEHDEQAALFECIDRHKAQYPELALVFAIPNGGHRHKAVAARMKAEGVRRGVPDVFVAVPRFIEVYKNWTWLRYWKHGLFIELKAGRNKPTPDQVDWLEALDEAGYRTEVCYGWEQAWSVICNYLGITASGQVAVNEYVASKGEEG